MLLSSFLSEVLTIVKAYLFTFLDSGSGYKVQGEKLVCAGPSIISRKRMAVRYR